MSDLGVTHCLTIGRRPDLLRQTLLSVHQLKDLPTLAVNDFGDTETNDVLTELVPTARIVGPSYHLGHHRAVDEMYRHVETPYIFHNEDDWTFSRTDFLPAAIALLNADPLISAVCVRSTDDFGFTQEQRAKIVTEEKAGIPFQRLTALHDQWYGFTFNPNLCRRSLWESLGGYAGFEKERHVSRHLLGQGRYVAFLLPEACRHIGDGRSTVWKDSSFRRFKNWLRGKKSPA